MYRFTIDLGFQRFRAKKLQTAITFDRELGLRRSKNESCSKWGNEPLGQPPENSKISSFMVSFFFLIFHLFFYIAAFDFTYLYLLKNSDIFCGVFLYRLEIYQFIIFFKIDNTTSVVWPKLTWCVVHHVDFG